MSYLADENLTHRTIKTYLSGVRYLQIRSGLPDPFHGSHMPRLDYTMKGVKRVQAKGGGNQRTHLPITPALLRRMEGFWAVSAANHDTKLIWVACCLCFFGFLRAGEMTTPDDGSFDPSVQGSRAGPLFVFSDGRLLTRKRFVTLVREALAAGGIDQDKYCGHSFRIGAATTAAARGIEDSVIKTLGRWESVAYLQYVRIPRQQLTGYSSVLCASD